MSLIHLYMQAEKFLPWTREKNRAQVFSLSLFHSALLLIWLKMLHAETKKLQPNIYKFKTHRSLFQ